MTLAEARKLRDEVSQALACRCTVPLGHGPDEHFVRANLPVGVGKIDVVDFGSLEEWRDFLAEYQKHVPPKKKMRRPPNALARMIDKACGIKEEDYE
jgi:hypothetical protein